MFHDSTGSSALLASLQGLDLEEKVRATPSAMGPTIVLVSDPLEDVEEIVARLDEATSEGRRRNALLARRGAGGLGVGMDGRGTFAGRSCCLALTRRIDAGLHRLRLPQRFTCEECGRVWSVEQRVREERRHG